MVVLSGRDLRAAYCLQYTYRICGLLNSFTVFQIIFHEVAQILQKHLSSLRNKISVVFPLLGVGQVF